MSKFVMHCRSSLCLLGICLLALTSVGCAPTAILIRAVPDRRTLDENEVRRDGVWAADKIALIDVDGTIFNGRARSLTGTLGENPVSLFTEKLTKAANDDHVKAVVLRLNTPGGSVTASHMMYEELRNFRAETGKPVVAAMLDVAASGGYYLACACDQIWAQPSTITGSIGVVMMTPNVTDTLSMIGARMITFTSGPMKDAGSPFRPMKPEEKAHFQHLIDTMYADFLAIVDQGRPKLRKAQIRSLADGRVFLGRDALQEGLVDQIGSLEDSIAAAQQLAGLSDEEIIVVQYARPIAYRPNIYAQPAAPGTAESTLPDIPWPFWLEHSTPQFLYLWAPGW